MYNFDKWFIAKIQGVWVPVKGQIIEASNGSGWKCLFCKHNGYAYWIMDGYQRFNDDTTYETLRKAAIKYNTADMSEKIRRENQAVAERNLDRPARWRPGRYTQILEQEQAVNARTIQDILRANRAGWRRQ